MHSSFTRVSIHPRVTRNVANERSTCANKSQSKKRLSHPWEQAAQIASWHTRFIWCIRMHRCTVLDCHLLVQQRSDTRVESVFTTRSPKFRLTRMHRWIARFPIFSTESYFILLPRYWYIKYINNGVRESKRSAIISPIKIFFRSVLNVYKFNIKTFMNKFDI